MALELLYLSYFKSYRHLKFPQIFEFSQSRFQYINFIKQSARPKFCDSFLIGFFSTFYDKIQIFVASVIHTRTLKLARLAF